MYLLNSFSYKPLNDKKLNLIYKKRKDIITRVGKGSNKYVTNNVSQNTNASRSILSDIFSNKTPTEAKTNLVQSIEKGKKILNTDLNIVTKDTKNKIKDLNKLSNMYKSKSKLLTTKNLGIAGGALAVTGLGAIAVNKLRKSRKDKGKLRGKYK